LLHRGGRLPPTAAGRPIGLGDDSDDLLPLSELMEGRDRKLRRPHEYHPHGPMLAYDCSRTISNLLGSAGFINMGLRLQPTGLQSVLTPGPAGRLPGTERRGRNGK